MGDSVTELAAVLMRIRELDARVERGEHMRETLRLLIHHGTAGPSMCNSMHCEEVLREREPWLWGDDDG